MSATGAGSGKVLVLYRQLLRAAKNYPSVKKNSIYQEIRSAFRENRALSPGSSEVSAAIQEGETALFQLGRFTGSKDSKDIEYSQLF